MEITKFLLISILFKIEFDSILQNNDFFLYKSVIYQIKFNEIFVVA